MRLHFVTVPIHDGGMAEEELNQFLAGHRVVSVDRQLVADGARSAWAVCVTYTDGSARLTPPIDAAQGKKSRVDYRDILPSDQFQVFVKLRDLRKTLSDKEAVPPYAIFTNEQLAEMIRRGIRSLSELGQIEGIGPSRIEKYGASFLALLDSEPTTAAPPAP